VIVFGSDYRTPPGHAEPGNTAQHLIEGGSVAIAVAAAGLRTRADAAIKWIAVANDGDGAAQQTADLLASKLGATIVEAGEADLIVVGSHAGGLPGRIALSGANRSKLSSVHGSVLILPAGKPAQL
jgi:nucleotide-binding universal stress UspA family protein